MADSPGQGQQTSEASANPGQSPAAESTGAMPDSGDQEEKDGVIDGGSSAERIAPGHYVLFAVILVAILAAFVVIVFALRRRQAA